MKPALGVLLTCLAWMPASAAPPVPPPAPAAEGPLTLQLDAQRSRIEFTLGATLHEVKGSLRLVEGSIRFEASGGAASGRIVVDATSAATGNEARDRTMHGKVLESARFPRIVLAVDRLDGAFHPTGRSELRLRGTLELHGTSRPIAMPVVATVAGDAVTATGSLTVPYVDWGLRDPSTFLLRVDREVRVNVRATGRLAG
jgi:polyisoprenoid-binding protein YceI